MAARPAEHYKTFIFASLAVATLGGFMLGFHIPLGRLLDWSSEARRPDMIQVHGQAQLLGFAGLFVIGMSLRMMPRFAGAPLKLDGLVPLVWGLIVGSMVTRVFVQVWLPDEPRAVLAVVTSFMVLIAAWAYLLIVVATLTVDRGRMDGTSWFFLMGAVFFFLQAGLAAAIAADEVDQPLRVLSYLPNMALLHLQIFGFLLAFIGGVGTRAFPSMMGKDRPDAGSTRAAILLSGSVLLLALPLLWAEYGGYSSVKMRLAGLGLAFTGLVLLEMVRLTGVLTPAANRVARASRAQFQLIRAAMLWMALGGVFAVYLGASSVVEGTVPAFHLLDAMRHAFALGVITTAILGMSMLILPEFAAARAGPNRQAQFATGLLALLTAVTVARVGAALLTMEVDADIRHAVMAIAGIAIELAVVLFLIRFVMLARKLSRGGLAPLSL